MTSRFIVKHVPEPDLVFGNSKEDKDPRIGLKHFGPYYHPEEQSPLESIRVGLIGNKVCTYLVKRVLEIIEKPLPSTKPNKWLFSDYPGMNRQSRFNCIVKTSENWNELLSDDSELNKVLKIKDANERIGYAVELYLKKIENVAGRDDPPDVIVCTLPAAIENYCGIGKHTYGAKTAKASPLERIVAEHVSKNQKFLTQWINNTNKNVPPVNKGFDFRNSLKGRAMKHGIPLQLIRQSTMKRICDYDELHDSGQDPATFSWNFGTALYYKAKGKPWRLAKLNQTTCYIGITFFVNKLSPIRDVQISMAQVFTHNGEGLVLRGTEVNVDEKTKRPYLKQEQAEDLMNKALDKYRDLAKRTPTTVVVHKSTEFSKDEQEGFNRAIYRRDIAKKDFVAIKSGYGWINFIRLGDYPVLRGTLVELGPNEFILYSSGYSPRIRTYAGHRIPNPLRIIHIGDSSNEHIAKEILGLTKLNWNTTDFSTSRPITLTFADEVGKILSELHENENVQDHYRFFM